MDELPSAELSSELCDALEGEALVGTPLLNHYRKAHPELKRDKQTQPRVRVVRYY